MSVCSCGRQALLTVAAFVLVAFGMSRLCARAAEAPTVALGAHQATKLALPGIFADNMVLEQARSTVWGTGEAWAVVTVAIGPVTTTAKADSSGAWHAEVKGLKAPGPYTMVVTDGSTTLNFKNIAVGQVWLCAGSTRMDDPVSALTTTNGAAPAASHADVRFFDVPAVSAYQPTRQVNADWAINPPAAGSKLSALAYLFASSLSARINEPVGIIQATQHDAPGEAFVPIEAIAADDSLSPIASWYDRNRPPANATDPGAAQFSNRLPAGLWNGMLAPIAPYSLAGVVWSQGDENVQRAAQYRNLLTALVKSWRRSWASANLPFIFVQSPASGTGTDSPTDSPGAELRDSQNSGLALPATYMEVSLDLFTDSKTLSADTQTLADRIAKAASFATTGEKVEYMGPTYKALKIENGAIRLKFDHADSGLAITEGDLLRTFQIAGPDRQWHWADARIEGKDVIVSLHEVPTPVAVRYAWADNWPVAPPPANLANRAGFPAGTFRTDAWPIITDGLVAGGDGYPTEKGRTASR